MDDNFVKKLKDLNKDRLIQTEVHIKVMRRFNAGRVYYYPLCETSGAICKFLKQKTLVPEDIDRLKLMSALLGIALTIQAVPEDSESEVL